MTAYLLGRSAGDLRYGADQDPSYEQFLGRLLEFIPGDVVAGYVVVLGLLPGNSSQTASWTTAIVFAVLTPILVVLGSGSEARDRAVFKFRLVAAPTAFAVWVIALPASPVHGLAGWIGSLALVAVTILLTAVDQYLEKAA